MTDEELAKLYYQASYNAMLYGTGFVKVSHEDGKIKASIVDPKDYELVQPKQENNNV